MIILMNIDLLDVGTSHIIAVIIFSCLGIIGDFDKVSFR